MKKLTLLIAALVLSFTAQATIVNCNPGTNNLSWYLTQGDTLVLADGEYIEQWSFEFKKEGVVVMAAEGAKPIIKASSYLQHKATTTFIGITFDGQDVAEYTTYSYKTDIEKDLTFINCEFKNYTESCVTIGDGEANVRNLLVDGCTFDGGSKTPAAIKSSGIISACDIKDTEIKGYTEYGFVANSSSAHTEELSIDNTIIHDCGYSAIYVKAAADGKDKQSCSSFELTNSTIYNIGDNTKDYGAIDIRDNANIASTQQVLIDHVTLYNFTTKDWYGGFMIYKSANATISNCIASNPDNIYTKYCNPFHAYVGATVNNCIYYNAHISSESTATFTNCVEADPMFVDAANGDFMLYAESPAVGMGDPRWGVKAGIQPGEGKLKDAVDAAQPGATIVLGDETYEVFTSIEFDVEGLTIVAAEGTKPVIKLVDEEGNSSLKLSATTTFDGITFDGNNITKFPVTSTGTDASQFTFINCEFKNYTKWAITNEYRSSHVDNVIIDKCLFHDGGSAVYFNPTGYNGQHSCSYFKMTNTTIYNINYDDWGVGVIHVSANGDATGEQNEVEIDHITMYNVSTKEYGAITVRKSSKLSVTNSIIANPASNSDKYAFYIYGGNVTNTLYHNSKVNSDAPSMSTINADPLFVNAAENNFDLYANSPAVGAGTNGSNLGDPRWGVSAKVLGKRINVTPDQAGDLPWMIQSDESNVKAGDTIVLAAGTYELSSFELRKEGLVIMAAENAEVKIATKEGEYLQIVATTTFDGITFDGSNGANYAIRSIGTSAKNLIVHNCKFTQYARYNIYGADGTHMDSLVVDNCIFSNSGAAIYFPASTLADNVPGCSYAKVTNSTLYNIILNDYVAAIDIQENNDAIQTGNTEVVIDHVTIYNFSSTAKSAIKVYKSGKTNITNSIVANPAESDHYSFMIYEGAKVQNCLEFNAVGHWASNAYTDTICADPLFVDAANNDFMLQANSPAIGKATDGTNLGDPRWGVAEPELITLTTGDNDAVIEANIGKTVNVKIERSFKANDGYYTLCVPFNMDPSVIGKAYSLGTITEHVSGEGININLEEESELLAGVPYLVLPKANMSELVVENVTIQSDIASGRNVYSKELNVNIFFEGFYSASGQTNGTTQYYVGNNGYLYNGEVEIRGLCGLFTITDKDGNPIKVRARVVTREEVETGLDNNQLPNTNIQKVLENGQLIIIRDGVKYNVQGQVIK